MEHEPQPVEAFSFETLAARLEEKFGVSAAVVEQFVVHTLGCKKEGDWEILPSDEEGKILIRRANTERGYIVGTARAKIWDKVSGAMIDTPTLTLVRKVHLDAAPTVGFTPGKNETGHYMPPNSPRGGRR